ncbi:MAG TPA: shikimate dehydrogenase [Clostridia bacterium]|nr:shikimate dehydrogenase [Clostridia bacterium]
MIHPLELADVSRKFPFAGKVPKRLLQSVIKYAPPVTASRITGLKSPYGEAEGWFVGCVLTSEQMLTLPTQVVLNKIIRAGRLAEKLGAKILGLGAMTAVVGDAGITVAKALDIPVTTGNSYTVYTAIEGVQKAAEVMEIDLATAEVVVLGATGAIGAIAARMMARECRYLTLVARNESKLENLAEKILQETGLVCRVTKEVKKAVRRADIIIAVTSAADAVIHPEDLKPGAVVCDVARPRDVSVQVAKVRDDVLVIEGGLVEMPGQVDFGLDFGYPPGIGLACMAETMMLALEGRFEDYTLGRELTLEQVEETGRLARKHGFRLAGFRSFERPVTEETIQTIKRRAREKRGERRHA